MIVRRVLTAGALLCALVAPAGCGDRFDDVTADPSGSAAPSLSPSPPAGEVLAKAATASEKQNLRYTLKADEDTVECVYDAKTGGTRLTDGSGADGIEFLVFPGEFFLTDPRSKVLYRVDAAKVPADSTFTFLSEPLFARAFLAAATDVRPDSAGGLTGTLDLTKVPAGTGRSKAVADMFARAAGAKATAIPFTATVDAQGRFTGLAATFPGADDGKDLEWDLRIVEFGNSASVVRPTGYQELPPERYKNI